MANPPPRTRVADAPPNGSSEQSSSSKGVGGRKGAILELIGVATIPLATIAALDERGKPDGHISPFALDVYTIGHYQEPLADALVTVADNYPVLGAALDRLGSITPFGAILGVVLGLGAQLAENHGALPEPMRTAPTLIPRDVLAQRLWEESKAKQDAPVT